MINLEHKITVDDLIVEYMIYKITNGYEPEFLTSEFISFLHFYEKQMEVDDVLYNGEELFKRFFERKALSDWKRITDWYTMEGISMPRMEMSYSKKDNDYLIKASYLLKPEDLSMLNSSYKGNGFFTSSEPYREN